MDYNNTYSARQQPTQNTEQNTEQKNEQKTYFDTIREQDFDSVIKIINAGIQKAIQTGKPPKGSRTFSTDSGLGVVFSVLENYCRPYNYTFNGTAFVPKMETESEDISIRIFKHKQSHKKEETKKATVVLYKDTEEKLKTLQEKYDDFSKTDLINYFLMQIEA